MYCRLHGALAASAVRDSATAVHHELLECYALIEKLGRGVVYYGSARLKQDSPHWACAVELGKQVAELLGCTTWSGGGPGMMEAATAGHKLSPPRVMSSALCFCPSSRPSADVVCPLFLPFIFVLLLLCLYLPLPFAFDLGVSLCCRLPYLPITLHLCPLLLSLPLHLCLLSLFDMSSTNKACHPAWKKHFA